MAKKRRRPHRGPDEDFSKIADLSIESRVPNRSDDFIKKLRGESAQHESEEVWLISYADLMTLLMGFFALLLSFSEFKQENFEKVKESTTKYFGGEYTVPYEKFAKNLKKYIEQKGLKKQVTVKNNADGVVISFRGSLMFESAKSGLTDNGQTILSQVLPIIKKSPDKFKINIEGHTDNVPIKTANIRNNWDLGGLRASTVAALFESRGFDRKNILLTSFADTLPIVPNIDEKGSGIPNNQAQNRRVVIKLSPRR